MTDEKCGTCRGGLGAQNFFDRYYKKRLCGACFSAMWEQAKAQAFGEWFEANYKMTDYPREFWNSVAAFINLPQNDGTTKGSART